MVGVVAEWLMGFVSFWEMKERDWTAQSAIKGFHSEESVSWLESWVCGCSPEDCRTKSLGTPPRLAFAGVGIGLIWMCIFGRYPTRGRLVYCSEPSRGSNREVLINFVHTPFGLAMRSVELWTCSNQGEHPTVNQGEYPPAIRARRANLIFQNLEPIQDFYQGTPFTSGFPPVKRMFT